MDDRSLIDRDSQLVHPSNQLPRMDVHSELLQSGDTSPKTYHWCSLDVRYDR